MSGPLLSLTAGLAVSLAGTIAPDPSASQQPTHRAGARTASEAAADRIRVGYHRPSPGSRQLAPGQDAAPVPFPHPLITEVLYAVPSDKEDPAVGDANLDGSRHATGDEFIELTNPHDQPINLANYALEDAAPANASSRFRFLFPDITVPPGRTVVVFNGVKQTFTGPVGTETQGPPSTDRRFHYAAVFNAQAKSTRTGFSNAVDAVRLIDPLGQTVTWIAWGKLDQTPPRDTIWAPEVAKARDGSITLDPVSVSFVPHAASDGVRYSPGEPFPFHE
ncbi:MAG: lamin tail domain-containing protein [Planctomycetota bacterium]